MPPAIMAASGTRTLPLRFAVSGVFGAAAPAAAFALRFTACAPFFIFFTWLSNMAFPFIMELIYADTRPNIRGAAKAAARYGRRFSTESILYIIYGGRGSGNNNSVT